jgi:methylmalonyl-CoA/ethylmalonyl-CoA epimerase
MDDALRPFVTAIDHVGIAVPDLEAMLRAPGAAGTETMIQLLAPLREDSAIGKFLAKSGPGLQQLAYRVSDVDAAAEALRAQGLRLLYAEAKRGTSDSRVNFVHPKDAGGVLVELVEPAQNATH